MIMYRCVLCHQQISSLMEIKYHFCSHCVTNFEQRPVDMSIEKWLSQFQLEKRNAELTCEKMQ